MNNILISIKPQWCNLILNGRKTLEIQQIVEQALEMFYSDRKEHT